MSGTAGGSVCAFTGHRASKLPWGYDERDARCAALKRRILDVTEAVCSSGVRSFLCGMASGCDLYFCEAVLELRKDYHDILLEAAIPYAGQAERWSGAERARWRRLVNACDRRTVLCQNYSRECMMERNRYMIDRCDILIACFDGQSGGTLNTLRYAQQQDREIIRIPI